MNAKQSRLSKHLQRIISERPLSLNASVAKEALDYQNVKDFFSDLLRYGCQSGMIGKLIYYADTHAFFDAHYEDIEELRIELEESTGEALKPNGDLKNWYAWFGFEETARKLADELGIDW